jgi:hypothetical protein
VDKARLVVTKRLCRSNIGRVIDAIQVVVDRQGGSNGVPNNVNGIVNGMKMMER